MTVVCPPQIGNLPKIGTFSYRYIKAESFLLLAIGQRWKALAHFSLLDDGTSERNLPTQLMIVTVLQNLTTHVKIVSKVSFNTK